MHLLALMQQDNYIEARPHARRRETMKNTIFVLIVLMMTFIVSAAYNVGDLQTDNNLIVYLPLMSNASNTFASLSTTFATSRASFYENSELTTYNSCITPDNGVDADYATGTNCICSAGLGGAIDAYHIFNKTSQTGSTLEHYNSFSGKFNITIPDSCFGYNSTHYITLTTLYAACGSPGLSVLRIYCYDSSFNPVELYTTGDTTDTITFYDNYAYFTSNAGYTAYTNPTINTEYYNTNGLIWSNSFSIFGNNSARSIKNDYNTSQSLVNWGATPIYNNNGSLFNATVSSALNLTLPQNISNYSIIASVTFNNLKTILNGGNYLITSAALGGSVLVSNKFYDQATFTTASSANVAQCVGYVMNTTTEINVTAIQKYSLAAPTRCFIWNISTIPGASGNCITGMGSVSPLAWGTFSGDICTLNNTAWINASKNFTIMMDNSGAAWLQYYSVSNQMPTTGNTTKIIYAGAFNNGVSSLDLLPRSIIGLHFEDMSITPSSDTVNSSEIGIKEENGNIYCINRFGGWNNRDVLGSNLNLRNNTPYDIACTFNSTDLTLYVNGQYINKTTFTNTSLNGSKFTIGRLYNTTLYDFNGSIQSLKIYNRSLTSNEINYNYYGCNSSLDLFGNTNGSCYFDENSFIRVQNNTLSNTNSLSICYWRKNDNGINSSVFRIGNTNSTHPLNGLSVFSNYNSSDYYYTLANNGFTGAINNDWIHECTILTSSTLKRYINGELNLTESLTAYTLKNNGFFIGSTGSIADSIGFISNKGQNSTQNPFKGWISQFMVYNRELNENEITVLYNGYNFSVNVYVFNELSNSILSGLINLDLIAENSALSLRGETNPIFINSFESGINLLRFSSTGFYERFHYLNISGSNNSDVTVYLLSDQASTNITFTVYDNNNNVVPNVYITALRYFVSNNSYISVAMGKTNDDGVVIIPLQFNAEYYKFFFQYPYGENVYQTTPSYIISQDLLFQLALNPLPGQDFVNTMNILSSGIRYDNATQSFTYSYSNVQGTNTETVLAVYRQTRAGEYVLINSTSLVATAGTLVTYYNIVNDTQYLARSYVLYDDAPNIEYTTDSISIYTPTLADLGSDGLYMTIILTVCLIFVGYFSIALMVIVLPIPLLVAAIIGFVNVSVPLCIGLEVAALIVAWLIDF